MCTPCPSGAVGHAFAQQARRPQRQHEDQHDEGEDVLVVAAQHAAGEVADVAGAELFDQAEQDAADHRAAEIADAAEHRRREGLQAGQEAHRVLRRCRSSDAYITPAMAASAAPMMKVAEITQFGFTPISAGDARVLGGRRASRGRAWCCSPGSSRPASETRPAPGS